MKTVIKFVAFIALFITASDACDCRLQTPLHSYCNAHWVAHVQVTARHDNQRMPKGITDNPNLQNTRYEIKYIQMFKISKSMPTKEKNEVLLPVNIYTATEDAACGINLEPTHEYLLAGRYINGTMITQLCGQILLEDLKMAREHDILEWQEVPAKLQEQLNTQEFDNKCEEVEKEMADENHTIQKPAQ